jgi:hypothetical protein
MLVIILLILTPVLEPHAREDEKNLESSHSGEKIIKKQKWRKCLKKEDK